MGYIVRWHSDLVNTKESLLPVCDKPYYKGILQKGKEIEKLRNYALEALKSSSIFILPDMS